VDIGDRVYMRSNGGRFDNFEIEDRTDARLCGYDPVPIDMVLLWAIWVRFSMQKFQGFCVSTHEVETGDIECVSSTESPDTTGK